MLKYKKFKIITFKVKCANIISIFLECNTFIFSIARKDKNTLSKLKKGIKISICLDLKISL